MYALTAGLDHSDMRPGSTGTPDACKLLHGGGKSLECAAAEGQACGARSSPAGQQLAGISLGMAAAHARVITARADMAAATSSSATDKERALQEFRAVYAQEKEAQAA